MARLKINLIQGFTLLELVIASSIFVIITTVILVRFSGFNNQILTTNLAYDIALSIRRAQSFGINVSGFSVGGNTTFDTDYGIYLSSTNNQGYIFYADLNSNNQYDNGELVEQFSLSGQHRLKNVCGLSGGASYCFNTGGISNLNVVFRRPDPDASIKSFNPTRTFDSFYITIVSPQGTERLVRVFSTGQISIVKNP